LRFVAGMFAFMILGGALASLHSRPDQEWLRFLVMTSSFHGATLLLAANLLREQGSDWSSAFGLGQGRVSRALVVGAVAGAMTLPLAWVLTWVSAELMRACFIEPSPQEAVSSLQASQGWMQRLSMSLMTVMVAPMAEEVMFRGILYPILKQRIPPWLAILATSLLFGAIHQNLMLFVPLSLFSVILVWLYEHTGNLLAPIAAHSMFNLANVVVLFG
jgi:membrane protease YdiL (CAAX protease family)